jgi:UPF0271 protein
MTIDLNCDMGEGMPHDAAIMPYISSANIACGYHAGDESTVLRTIELCLKHNVAVGAHAGFDDKPNFGRLPVQLSKGELYQLVWKQLEIIQNICEGEGAELHHVKPHGALYHMAVAERLLSYVVAKAVYDFNPGLIYYGLSGSVMISEAKAVGLKTANEVFADRTYQPDGSLTPRTQPHALLTDVNQVVAQAVQLVTRREVTCTTGEVIALQADSLCIHGDEPHAPALVRSIRAKFKRLGIQVNSLP